MLKFSIRLNRVDDKDAKASVDTLAELENIDDECDQKVWIKTFKNSFYQLLTVMVSQLKTGYCFRQDRQRG